MSTVKNPCRHCYGDHEPDTPESWVEFNGRRYRPPFKCLCCGCETCMRQFAYGRSCGPCDCGACQSGHSSFMPQMAHPYYNPKPYIEAAEVIGG